MIEKYFVKIRGKRLTEYYKDSILQNAHYTNWRLSNNKYFFAFLIQILSSLLLKTYIFKTSLMSNLEIVCYYFLEYCFQGIYGIIQWIDNNLIYIPNYDKQNSFYWNY